MKTKAKVKREDKTPLMIRLDPGDAKKFDELAKRVRFATKTALAVELMLIGIEEVEKNPARLVQKA